MENSITLDWLAFTSTEETDEFTTWVHLYASPDESISIAPTNGYRTAYRAKTGVVVQWNADRTEMGYHVVIAGTALRHILEYYELDQKALLRGVLHTGARITRLDIALDVQGVRIDLDEVYKWLESKNYKGTAKTISQIHSLDGGNTIYVGSRQSERFIRIYDKAAQQKLQGELWTRFELETKGMVARALATLLASPDVVWLDVFSSTTRRMVDVPRSENWKLLQPGNANVGIPKIEKKSDREKWIEIQVVPAVAKHYQENRRSHAVKLLRDILDLIDRNE